MVHISYIAGAMVDNNYSLAESMYLRAQEMSASNSAFHFN